MNKSENHFPVANCKKNHKIETMKINKFYIFLFSFGIPLLYSCAASDGDDSTLHIGAPPQRMRSDPNEELKISSVIPASGPKEGGIPVVIHGSQFFHIATVQDQAKVFFDGILATRAIVQTDNTLVAWVPHSSRTIMPGNSVSVPITIEKQDGKKVEISDIFSYQEPAQSSLAAVFTSDPGKQVLSTALVGPNPYSIVTGDFNEDGILDFALSNFVINPDAPQDQNVRIFLGDKMNKGQFLAPLLLSLTGTGLSHLAVGDMNKDGHVDLVVAERAHQDLLFFLGKGDGSFQAPVTQALGNDSPGNIELVDVDQDGNVDLVMVINSLLTKMIDGQKIYDSGHTVQIWRGNGMGTFQKQGMSYEVGRDPGSLVVADLNQDGYLDIITASYTDSTIFVGVNQGKTNPGLFTKLAMFESGMSPNSLALADLNEDKIPDLLVGSEGGFFSIYQGKGDGSFGYLTTLGGRNLYSYSFAVADFDLDGHLDIATSGPLENFSSHTLSIFHGLGTGFLSAPSFVESGNSPCMVITGNVDGDAEQKPDLLVVNRGFDAGTSQSSVRAFINQSKKN